MWRDWFTFTRQDRRAIILLSIAIVAVWLALYLRPKKADHTLLSEATDSIATTLTPTKSETAIVQIDRHRFNPNEADSLELLTLGLPHVWPATSYAIDGLADSFAEPRM